MKILLIGEYSRLHLTLAEGLRTLGHEVTVASDGDGFKGYSRDIDLYRRSSGLCDTLYSLMSTLRVFSQLKGYDVVQFINPNFTPQNLRINRYLYNKLRRNNKQVFLGAFGDDSYWLKMCMENKLLRYSEFYVDGKPTNIEYNEKLVKKWVNSDLENFNIEIAGTSDGIIACLYEYYKAYENSFPDKLVYIPLPVNTHILRFRPIENTLEKVVFFIGINKERSEFKGTDIMERALIRLKDKYPDKVIVHRAESVSYTDYNRMMSEAHVVLDQLYSYTPAMNALNAMAMGKVVVSGGEPEMYELLGEDKNKPIINVHPTEEDVFDRLEYILLHKDILPQLSKAGRQFVEEHHDYRKVAEQYLQFWNIKRI